MFTERHHVTEMRYNAAVEVRFARQTMHTVAFFILICFGAAKAANAQSSYRNIAYFVNWAIYARNYNVNIIPASRLSHINYAFAAVDPTNGTVYV